MERRRINRGPLQTLRREAIPIGERISQEKWIDHGRLGTISGGTIWTAPLCLDRSG